MKVCVITLGCKVNQYESQAMQARIRELGHEICTENESPDAVIINSCAVTGESARKSRQAVRRARLANPASIVAVCGCYSQLEPDTASALGADLVFGSSKRLELVDELVGFFVNSDMLNRAEHDVRAKHIEDLLHGKGFEHLPAGVLSGRTRALLKVQDGCSNFCAYCVIPYARGPARSLPLPEAVSEALRLDENGIQEIVITGIEISSYGCDLEGSPGLPDLLQAISEAVPLLRLRLGSLEPGIVTPDFADALAALPNLCPHFHLSLQSGCDSTLSRMGRKYGTSRFYEAVRSLRERFPGCGLTADLIVGFPGETDEEFEETLAFIKTCAFSSMHIFPYSERSGTRAAGMSGKLSNAVKTDRAKRASALSAVLRKRFLDAQTGTVHEVLFERESKDGCASGYTRNYCEVFVPDAPALRNQVRSVLICSSGSDRLAGVLLGDNRTGLLTS